MSAVYITHTDCLRHDMGPDHPECAARIDHVQDCLLAQGLLDCMLHADAPLASRAQLVRAHSGAYVDGLFAISPIDDIVPIDPDTRMGPYTLQAALRAAGAVVHATDMVLQGKATTAFCNVRPPGHHATRNAAMGFCFFNNVVVGIRHAIAQYGLKRIALIDFDVHHGNGSEDILANDPHVLMCSTFGQNIYPFCGDAPLGDNMVNVGLPPYACGKQFRQAVAQHWLPALAAYAPEILYISAGFDAHHDDDMGNLGLVDDDYAWVTQALAQVAARHCQGRVISCLEGGYEFHCLARSAAAHVRALVA